jgi:O-antigen ligase
LYGAIFLALAWLCNASAPVAQVLRLNSLATDGSRMSLWRDAWHAILSEPLWGIGPMQFAAARHANPVGAHPHNLLLQIAAEWGLPVATLMAAAVVAGLRSLRFTVRAAPGFWKEGDWTLTDPKLGAALFMGCIAALIDAQFSGNAVMPVPQVWLAVLIGWAVAFGRCCQASNTLLTEEATHAAQRRIHLLPLAVLVAALNTWNAGLTCSDLSRLQAMLDHAATLAAGHKTTPRYWSNGRF